MCSCYNGKTGIAAGAWCNGISIPSTIVSPHLMLGIRKGKAPLKMNCAQLTFQFPIAHAAGESKSSASVSASSRKVQPARYVAPYPGCSFRGPKGLLVFDTYVSRSLLISCDFFCMTSTTRRFITHGLRFEPAGTRSTMPTCQENLEG